MEILHETIIEDVLKVRLWRRSSGREMACTVISVANDPTRASLEWLIYSGNMEDGDAEFPVDPSLIAKAAAWAEENGYPTERCRVP